MYLQCSDGYMLNISSYVATTIIQYMTLSYRYIAIYSVARLGMKKIHRRKICRKYLGATPTFDNHSLLHACAHKFCHNELNVNCQLGICFIS